jgi:hypothetical protein
MKKIHRNRKTACAVFDTIRLLEKAHIAFDIKRTRPDAITITATTVGERIEIDVFEDDHIEISRFRGNESVEGGMELLIQIVKAEIEENYPEELSETAAK